MTAGTTPAPGTFTCSSFVSPMARLLMGKAAGDVIEDSAGEIEIVSIG